MTPNKELLSLASRVEALDGRNNNGESTILTADIARALGWHRVEPRFTGKRRGVWIAPEDFIGTYSDGSPILDSLHGTDMHREPPAWLWSLDAAMSLVDGDTFFHVSRFSPGRVPAEAHVYPNQYVGDDYISEGATPALALTAAALRARAYAREAGE